MSAARIARLSSLAALLLAAAWLFLPAGLGGSTTYVSTFGTSMEPGFTAGDLAILRPASGYAVGDVVAYRSASLDTTVMHRIVDGDAVTGFVLQGDNNTWLDEDRPRPSDVLGRLWLRVPQGGRALETLRSPAVLALVGIAAVTLLGATARTPRRRRRATTRATTPAVRSVPLPVQVRARRIGPVLAVAAVLGGAGTAALLVLPAGQTDVRTVPVTQTGQYSYTAPAVAGTTYPAGRVVTGEPIYTSLVGALTVTLDQTLAAPGLAGTEGTVHLEVAVAAPDGWTALITRGPGAPVSGASTSASVLLDPARALDVLRRHYTEIGAAEGGATLTVTPVTDVTGAVDGRPFTAAALPPLAFTLDATALRPAPDALTATAATTVAVEETAPRTFSVSGVLVTLPAARTAAAAVLVVAMLGLVVVTWLGRSPVADAAALFGNRLVRIEAAPEPSTVVDVADAAALHRVALRLDGLVLHVDGPDGAAFLVQDGDSAYRYRVPPTTPGVAERRAGGVYVGGFA